MRIDLLPEDALVTALTRVVGAAHVLADADLRAPFERDWTGRFTGPARLVVRPKNSAEVAAILRACNDAEVAVVPQGGNTGLVGGGVPRRGEVVLSLTRLDDLDAVDPLSGQVSAGAGVTLARLQQHAAQAGWNYPIDLAARDSATVGGMIATNAGGIRVLRYGSTRQQVVGIEAVTMDGRVLTRMAGLVKDNAGYDLAGLLTGSEGTLAVVTRARLRLVAPLAARVVAVLALDSIEEAQRTLARIRTSVPSLEAAEVFFADGLDLVLERTSSAPPFAQSHPVYLLVECAAQVDPTEELAAAVADASNVSDVAVASDGPGCARLWALREAHTEAIGSQGIPVKLDVSIPQAAMSTFIDRIPGCVAEVEPEARVILFGHLGDGNLHVNVLGADPDAHAVDDAVLRLVVSLGGSISAEHGIGRAKSAWLAMYRDPTDIEVMGAIKGALDPLGLLNPGVLLP